MHTAEVIFRKRATRAASPTALDALNGLMFAFERNGQLIPDCNRPTMETRHDYRVFVSIPEADSLRASRSNRYVREATAKLAANALARPQVRVLGGEPGSAPVCTCKRQLSMILATDSLTLELPTTCGGCGGVVPFYRFPHTYDKNCYDDIIFWIHQTRRFDGIWLASGVGELFAYRQLSVHDSELSQEGRKVCRGIENLTGIPVYYYLMKHRGRRIASERKRLCPSCGRSWLLDQKWHRRFDFRCEPCRLVSNIAFDAE